MAVMTARRGQPREKGRASCIDGGGSAGIAASWRGCERGRRGGEIEFFVGWFIETGNSGDEFEPELLVRLGELGIRLSLDVYATDSD